MTIYQLTLESLMQSLDGGRVSVAFDEELKRCVQDCEDRPNDEKARKVTLELQMTPVPEDGVADEVRAKFHVKSTVPQRKSKPYSFGIRKGGMLVFNDLSDTDINQQTIE